MQVQLARTKLAVVAVWACGAAAVAGIAYQSRAEATPRPDALECEEGELVMALIFEPVMEVPGKATPEAALDGLRAEFPADQVAALQAVERGNGRAVFARSERGNQRLVANVVDNGGWRLETAGACVEEQGGGRS